MFFQPAPQLSFSSAPPPFCAARFFLWLRRQLCSETLLTAPPPFVRRDSSYGSAARCEARLCLAVALSKQRGLCPSFGLWPIPLGRSPDQGQSPFVNSSQTAGHSPASHQAAEPIRKLTLTASHHSYLSATNGSTFASHQAAEPVRKTLSLRQVITRTSALLTDRLSSPVVRGCNRQTFRPGPVRVKQVRT